MPRAFKPYLDWPVSDRTSELRKKGFEGRRLGPKQMTTDTAVRVTRLVVQEKSKLKTLRYHLLREPLWYDGAPPVPLEEIPYIDDPELRVNKNESTEMPFRYVKGRDGQCIMPEVGGPDLISLIALTGMQGMIELIKKDSEKGFGDLFWDSGGLWSLRRCFGFWAGGPPDTWVDSKIVKHRWRVSVVAGFSSGWGRIDGTL
jgi:hypothetical protein